MQMPSTIAPVAVRPSAMTTRLSVVDHLDELRTRIIVSLLALAVAFGICFWQNHQLLHLINKPLAHKPNSKCAQATARWARPTRSSETLATSPQQLDTVVGVSRAERQPPAARASLDRAQRSLQRDVRRLSAAADRAIGR